MEWGKREGKRQRAANMKRVCARKLQSVEVACEDQDSVQNVVPEHRDVQDASDRKESA